MEEVEEIEGRLVMLLVELTRKGRATWVRRPSPNDEFLYCFVNHEEIAFQGFF